MVTNRRTLIAACATVAGVVVLVASSVAPVSGQGQSGTIVGHVKYAGPTPVNPVIRMGADPRCNKLYVGKRPTAPTFVVAADGGMANVFASLEGSFPAAPAPAGPVVIDQKDCVFVPHVVGGRIGQTLQAKNSDITGHNVHSLSMVGNNFNTSQPSAGMVFEYRLKAGEILRIKCDFHPWMSVYVAILDHPYFATTAADGTFTIANVPAGKQTVRVWHEVMGVQTQTVDVQPGKTTAVDFAFKPSAKPAAAVRTREFVLPAAVAEATLLLAAR